MTLFIYIYDRNGNLINDVDRCIEYASTPSFGSVWPGGYDTCSFTVQRDIAMQWLVKQAYDLQIKDGHTIVYQGRIEDLQKSLSVNESKIDVQSVGWGVVLKERMLRKRWIDNAPIDRFRWPASRKEVKAQQVFNAEKRDNFILVKCGYTDNLRTNGDYYEEEYNGPTGHYIRQIKSGYLIRTGESISILWINGADSSTETSVTDSSGDEVTGTLDVTLAGASTSQVKVRVMVNTSDTYDENDRAIIKDIIFYFHYNSSHYAYSSPTYTTGEIAWDVIQLLSKGDLSSDYNLIIDPGVPLLVFTTKNDKFESGDNIIARLLAFGGIDLENPTILKTMGCSVWGSNGSSDNKPLVEIKEYSTSTWKYEACLADLEDFTDSLSLDELENYIIVNYEDENNQPQCATPDDSIALAALLKDDTSIGLYGERHGEIDIGKASGLEVGAIGYRRLSYHKNPLRKSEFKIRCTVRTTEGAVVPVSFMRAGDAIKITDYQGGVVFFLRSVKFDGDVVTCSPDLPPDSLEIFMVRREHKSELKA